MGASQSTPTPHPDGKTMRAVTFSKHGKWEDVLEFSGAVPVPSGLSSTEILIKVRAASINPVDKALMEGGLKQLKPVKGAFHVASYDASGIVEEADQAGTYQKGDAVVVRLFGPGLSVEAKTQYCRGSMAEYCVADVSNVVRKPDNLSFEEAASFPLAGMTAVQVIDLCTETKDPKIFISGGAGGVGSIAIQYAKSKGFHVTTTASAGEKTELCTSLGADVVVDYKSNKFESMDELKDQFDLCFDCTGESGKMIDLVKSGGRIVTINAHESGITFECIADILERNGKSAGCLLKTFVKSKLKFKQFQDAQKKGADWDFIFLHPSKDDLQRLMDLTTDGQMKAVIDQVWDSKDWKDAYVRQFSGRSKGKCVVRWSSDDE